VLSRPDALYLVARFALAGLTVASSAATLLYAARTGATGRDRLMLIGGGALLLWAAALSGYDAVYNVYFSPSQSIARASWIWLLGFDLLLPIWALLLLKVRRERDLAQADLARLAVTDPLTGALNRRGFLDHAHPILARAERSGEPMAVAMLDLDRFKTINDGFGHDAGDDVLRGFSAELARGLRAGDLLGRFGGEEFVLLLPGIDGAGAVATVERLRAAVRAAVPHPAGGRSTVTASAGVAIVDTTRSAEAALAAAVTAADAALYEAKQAGRDRVAIAPALNRS
jgi:diguanylate cyclase (GGDEF)-like protein